MSAMSLSDVEADRGAIGISGNVVSGTNRALLLVAVLLLAGQHDAAARLREITIPGEGSVTYGQYQGGAPQQIVLPGGVVKSMAYDPLSGMVSNRVVDVSGNPVMERTYQRNRAGTITGVNTEHGSYTYAYDQIDQLTHVADPMLPDQAFSYDGAGNRVTSGRYPKPGTGDPELKTYTVNNLNQYLSVTSASSAVQMSYDLNGNVTQEVANGRAQVFRWDGENRLVGYSNSETGVSASYYYDPFGRRLRKVVNGVTNWYVYADEGLVEEMDGQGNEIRSYGYVPNSLWMNDPLYMRVPGIGTTNIYYFLNDHLGAPQKLVAKNGEVVWSMDSEAFGKATISPDSTITNHLRFSSQYYDEESGLHYNTYRQFSSEISAYLSRDPIEDEGSLRSILFVRSSSQLRSMFLAKWRSQLFEGSFRFCGNEPINHLDVLGLWFSGATIVCGANCTWEIVGCDTRKPASLRSCCKVHEQVHIGQMNSLNPDYCKLDTKGCCNNPGGSPHPPQDTAGKKAWPDLECTAHLQEFYCLKAVTPRTTAETGRMNTIILMMTLSGCQNVPSY